MNRIRHFISKTNTQKYLWLFTAEAEAAMELFDIAIVELIYVSVKHLVCRSNIYSQSGSHCGCDTTIYNGIDVDRRIINIDSWTPINIKDSILVEVALYFDRKVHQECLNNNLCAKVLRILGTVILVFFEVISIHFQWD